MNTVELLRPILNDRTRFVNYFNGRLLSAEALTAEQNAQREIHNLLGTAVGSGVVYGFDVERDTASPGSSPTLIVRQGLAINPRGQALFLAEDMRIHIKPPDEPMSNGSPLFHACEPPQSGAYVSGEGIYVLTVCPAAAAQGKASVSGLGNQSAACNAGYRAEGVSFRVIELPMTGVELADQAYLRNTVAYKFLNNADFADSLLRPLVPVTAPTGPGVTFTQCELPLAVFRWTSSGIQYVDTWSVRRSVARRSPFGAASPFLRERNLAEGEARFLQFQNHLDTLLSDSVDPAAVQAQQSFKLLPAAGIVPVLNPLQPRTFFTGITYREPVFTEGARLEQLLRLSFEIPALPVFSGEMVWLYWVRENMQAVRVGGSAPPRPYLVFARGQIPFFGEARFDVSRWNYANFM